MPDLNSNNKAPTQASFEAAKSQLLTENVIAQAFPKTLFTSNDRRSKFIDSFMKNLLNELGSGNADLKDYLVNTLNEGSNITKLGGTINPNKNCAVGVSNFIKDVSKALSDADVIKHSGYVRNISSEVNTINLQAAKAATAFIQNATNKQPKVNHVDNAQSAATINI